METKKKLTMENRISIVDLYKKGTTVVQLSKDFKVSRPTVYKILSKANLNPVENDELDDDVEENTSFLGVNIDTINGPFDFKIKKALKQSASLLNIMEFIKVTKFKLNMVMFDYFWQVMVGNRRVHLYPTVLEWFGYHRSWVFDPGS